MSNVTSTALSRRTDARSTAFFKSMIEVATGGQTRPAPSDRCQHWNVKPRSAVVPPAHGCGQPRICDSKWHGSR